MSSNGHSGLPDPAAPAPSPVPIEDAPMTRRQKFRLVVKVVELRLRFIVLMAGTALGLPTGTRSRTGMTSG